MPTEGRRNERDLILAPNEYAFILDETKGNIVNYVGPHKTSLANTDQPVVFNSGTKRFERCTLEEAVQAFAIAPEGWYLVLKNPATDGKMPRPGTANSLPDLNVGRKVNIPGPVGFAIWPGQMIRVIQGHHLRSNQYLVVRVYDEEGARANWGKAVIKPQTSSSMEGVNATDVTPVKDIPDLTMGKLLIIKGTDVSFYIPPTGIEVVPDQNEQYVRNAVTLERLEYCILLDENGNKRYIQGPAVVFPEPTETFVGKGDSYKFKAIELNEISGIYIKVTAPYEENGQLYKVGDELFITGKDQMIYFPRPEHAIIRYGEQEVHHAVAIPAGEGRYVLDRLTGQITLKHGPIMFLPDPRKEVIVRRVLDPKTVEIWFPGNQEALEYNRKLMEIARQKKGEEFVSEPAAKEMLGATKAEKTRALAPEEFVGDEFTRKQTFTQPRTITLDTKYEGAVAINVWTGYAVLVVSKTGQRHVVVGPKSYLLEYDETLETLEFSTGTPKTDDRLIKSVYLRVLHNKVSDVVKADTRDLCPVEIHVSYRVNFEGEPDRWFSVENYVKFLTDHLRSILRHTCKQHNIEEFYADAVRIVRDTVLGPANEEGKRTGRFFSENEMRVYDVEVLDVSIKDKAIAELLIEAQRIAVQETLELEAEKRKQALTEQKEVIKQRIAEATAITQQLMLSLQMGEISKRRDLDLIRVESETIVQRKQLEAKLTEQEPLDKINTAELTRQKTKLDLELVVAQQRLAQHLEELKAEVDAVVHKAQAVSPQLVAALQAFSDRALAAEMAESMAPLAILGGKSVADVLTQLLKGTVLEKALTSSTSSG
jgi:major vault protein